MKLGVTPGGGGMVGSSPAVTHAGRGVGDVVFFMTKEFA